MMKYLYNNIDWTDIEYIGFDMDGTLYDEFEFIAEVYSEISKQFNNENAKEYMLNRWLEKGSSYNKIFDETYELFSTNLIDMLPKDIFIDNCLVIFRNFTPQISLTNRAKEILSYFKNNYKLFLVSDGNLELQTKKFESLDLDKYFEKEYVFFTGIDSLNYSKPKIKCFDFLKILPEKTVFFGDRNIDKEFAKKAKMQFQKVYNMIGID